MEYGSLCQSGYLPFNGSLIFIGYLRTNGSLTIIENIYVFGPFIRILGILFNIETNCYFTALNTSLLIFSITSIDTPLTSSLRSSGVSVTNSDVPSKYLTWATASGLGAIVS